MPPTELNPQLWLENHGDALFRYAMLRLRKQTAAEDMVQETLLAAWASRDSYAGQAQERTWLISILRHKILDYLRQNKQDSPQSLSSTADPAIDVAFNSWGHWKNPPKKWVTSQTHNVETQEFWDTFHDCLSKLPDSLAHAFTLKMLDEQSPEEVCKVLGITTTNLWVMLHRARARLRTCLEINWFTPPTPPPTT